MKSIPYAHQAVNPTDIDEVVRVLRSDWLTCGPSVPQFEKNVADDCGAKYATAVSSGTAALHIACMALGLKKGDLLWTTATTFVASSNCGLYCGAKVDFVDIDPRTYNMSVAALEKKLKKAKKLPKIVIPVHLAGQSCEMEPIFKLSKKYGFKIIEDASHAIGSFYKGKKVGSCRYSDCTVFSFHPVKTITTGEGGMVVCNNNKLHRQISRLRTHGITRDPKEMQRKPHGPWYYEQIDLGYNYRITDFQCALGVSQMKRLADFSQHRLALVQRYNKLLADLPLTLPWQHPDTESCFHLYIIRLRRDSLRKNHRRIFDELRARGIGVNLHYMPVYFHPYYQKLGFKKGLCPEAEKYYAEAITLPLYVGLQENEQDQVVKVLREVLT